VLFNMVGIFSTPQQTKEYYEREAGRLERDAAQYAAADNESKSAEATRLAREARVQAAQMKRQIADQTPT
jgi:hypothetical protein